MFKSIVPGHEGPCDSTWINENIVLRRLDGGISGFFRKVKNVWWWPFTIKFGPEFHGIIYRDNIVERPNASRRSKLWD
jgi:hypothetical protein